MQEKSSLVLDIGTEAVKAGFLKNTSIQYYEKFGFFGSQDFEKEVIKKAVLRSLNEINKKASARPKNVVLGASAGVLGAEISFHYLERSEHQGLISQKEEEVLRRELFKKSREKISERFFQDSGIGLREIDFADEFFLETNIEGYVVPRLAGYRGKRVGAIVFSVFSPKRYLEKFQQLFEELELNISEIVHPARNLLKVLKDLGDGIFLDVGGEVTQIFIVKKGKLVEIFDFSAGGRSFSKALSQTFGLSEERARNLKERYVEDKIAEETKKRIHEIFSSIAEEWFLLLKSKLKGFKGLLPSDIFMFGGGSQVPELQKILENLTEENSPKILENPQLVNLKLISYDK